MPPAPRMRYSSRAARTRTPSLCHLRLCRGSFGVCCTAGAVLGALDCCRLPRIAVDGNPATRMARLGVLTPRSGEWARELSRAVTSWSRRGTSRLRLARGCVDELMRCVRADAVCSARKQCGSVCSSAVLPGARVHASLVPDPRWTTVDDPGAPCRAVFSLSSSHPFA